MDNRIALESGYCLKSPDGREFRITSEIGRGASCIVYEAGYADARMGEAADQTEESRCGFSAHIPAMSDSRDALLHMVRIKECYPLAVSVCREKDGALRAEREALFCEEKQKFLRAYEENVRIRTVSGLVNSTAEATCCFAQNHTEYIVTEYHEGITYDRIEESNLSELLTTALAVAEVIRGYHRQNLLYLDLKPCNVLILPESREHVVLFDFDSVCDLYALKEGKNVLPAFSDGYVPPELKAGRMEKLHFSADVYSLGVMVFEKIFHRFPTLSETSLEYHYDFNEAAFIDFGCYLTAVCDQLAYFFHKTLAASVYARWSSMDEVICALEALLEMLSGSLLLKNMLIECSSQTIRFDREIMKNTLENVKCEYLEEYEHAMNEKIGRAAVDLFREDGPVMRKFKEDYQSIFARLKQVLYAQTETEEVRAKIQRALLEYQKRFSDCIDRLADLEEIGHIRVDVQSEIPREVKILNLNKKETVFTKLFGRMETWYAAPLRSQERLEQQIDVILQQNEERVQKAYLSLLSELFESLAGALSGAVREAGSDSYLDRYLDARMQKTRDANRDANESTLYRRAMYILYQQNADRCEEGLRLLFDDYEKRHAKETLEELNRQLPVFDGEILERIDYQILFLRKKSDYETGGELLFGYKALDETEHIVFRLRTAYAVNNLSYRTLKVQGKVLFLLEDDAKLSLYVYVPEKETFYFLDAQRIAPVYGELILKKKDDAPDGETILYGKRSAFDREDIIYSVSLEKL